MITFSIFPHLPVLLTRIYNVLLAVSKKTCSDIALVPFEFQSCILIHHCQIEKRTFYLSLMIRDTIFMVYGILPVLIQENKQSCYFVRLEPYRDGAHTVRATLLGFVLYTFEYQKLLNLMAKIPAFGTERSTNLTHYSTMSSLTNLHSPIFELAEIRLISRSSWLQADYKLASPRRSSRAGSVTSWRSILVDRRRWKRRCG